MKLSIKNVGKLKEADVEINGITVITGENDTGKSTVGKVLWSVFNGFYEIDEKVYNEKVSELEKIIDEIIKENVYKNLSTDYNSFFEIFNSTREKIAIEFLKGNKNYSEDEIKIIINNYKKELSQEINKENKFTNVWTETNRKKEILKNTIRQSRKLYNSILSEKQLKLDLVINSERVNLSKKLIDTLAELAEKEAERQKLLSEYEKLLLKREGFVNKIEIEEMFRDRKKEDLERMNREV